jgi:hypothetical protein
VDTRSNTDLSKQVELDRNAREGEDLLDPDAARE